MKYLSPAGSWNKSKALARKFMLLSPLLFIEINCSEPPNYPLQPQIEFENLHFVDTEDPTLGDSLVLLIRFQDGDGDLGLDEKDTGYKEIDGKQLFFNNKFYFTTNKERVVSYESGQRLTYADKRNRPELNLPDYVKPYSCTHWEIKKDGDRKDTVYIELNENHYNIFVDFYVKQNDGSFQLFDWRKEFCTTFDGRFPILSKDLNQKFPLRGTLRYSMVSAGFKIQFSIKTLKLKIRIQDRLQRKSNEIETPEFQFT